MILYVVDLKYFSEVVLAKQANRLDSRADIQS